MWPYRQGSRSALALAEALGGRVLKLEGSKFVPRSSDLIINWGNGQAEKPWEHEVLNNPYAVHLAANKLNAFVRFQTSGVPIPRFATSRERVEWKTTTVVRHRLTGHSGAGIELVDKKEDLPNAPLYVEYIKKVDEYRVHVVGKSIIAVQRKARDREIPDNQVNWQIRNHANGFIFVREGFVTPESVTDVALQAIESLGLDFGAVDIVWNEKEQKAYVLEINSAPGLEGQTIDNYATAFHNIRATAQMMREDE